jgi:hypothetical protein
MGSRQDNKKQKTTKTNSAFHKRLKLLQYLERMSHANLLEKKPQTLRIS